MKEGIFITANHDNNSVCYDHPWHVNTRVYNNLTMDLPEGQGMLCLKKDFSVSVGKRPIKVTLRATALGIFDLFLNGKRVGAQTLQGEVFDELKPEWTDYQVRVLEYVYDVTDRIKNENTLMAIVSDGWWRGRNTFGYYGKKDRAFCMELECSYADGSTEIVPTDTSWTCTFGGRLRTASIWDGEYYDATYPDVVAHPECYSWEPTVCADFAADIQIEPHRGDPVRIRPSLEQHPICSTVYGGTEDNGSDFGRIRILDKKIGNGCEKTVLHKGETLLLDFGQEFVGWPEICVKAAKGTTIRGYFSELLNDSGLESRGNDGPEGSPYVKNYRSALSRMVYVAGGKGKESYHPSHTFYGFRYFFLTVTDDTEIFSVKGLVVGSDLRETATFETDNDEINRLYSNIVWGMRGNYLSVPTDCPQRDERLGWTGDTQIFAQTASYLADTRKFLLKWMDDARASQIGYNGAYADVIPRVWKEGAHAVSSCAWSDAGIIVPYKLWLMFGDKNALRENYASMEAYMKNLLQYGLEGPRNNYGDWLAYEPTDFAYLSVCYYAYDAQIMKKVSDVLGNKERAAYYASLLTKIKAYFAEKYISDGALTEQTQTAYLLALCFDLVSGDVKKHTIRLLRNKIRDNGYMLSTGFVGTGILNQTLGKVGLDQEAYSLLMQYKDPSWLYSLRQGATTVWERWNSYTREKGFGNVAMNSFNHYAYGAVAEWMFSTMAGIRPDEKKGGFRHLTLHPTPDMRKKLPDGQERIHHVKATYTTDNGTIESAWSRDHEGIVYRFTIPEGCEARVELLSHAETLHINGLALTTEELGAFRSGGRLVFRLKSGRYTIR